MIDNSCPLHTIPQGASFSIRVLGDWDGALVALKPLEVAYEISLRGGDDRETESLEATLDEGASVPLPERGVVYDLNLTFSDVAQIRVKHDFKRGSTAGPPNSTFSIFVKQATESGKYNDDDLIATIRMVRNLPPVTVVVQDPLLY